MSRKIVILFLLGTSLVLIGCGGSDAATNKTSPATPTVQSAATPLPVTAQEPTDTGGSSTNSTSAVSLLERLLPDPESRTFRYAGAEFVIQAASISNRDIVNPERTMPGNPWVDVAIQATNNQGYPVTTPRFEIAFADGTTASGLDGIRLNKNESTKLDLRGVVKPDTNWEGSVLTLSESDHEPLKIPLMGLLGTSIYPQTLNPGEQVTATTKYGEKIQVSVTDASLDIDGIVSGQRAVRAPTGKRFVRVNVEAKNVDAGNGMSVGSDSVQLTADGTAAELAFDETGAKTIPVNETANFTLYYLVPAESQAFKLIVAPDGQAPGEIVLTP